MPIVVQATPESVFVHIVVYEGEDCGFIGPLSPNAGFSSSDFEVVTSGFFIRADLDDCPTRWSGPYATEEEARSRHGLRVQF